MESSGGGLTDRRASLPSAGFLLLGVVAPDETRGSVSWMPSDISCTYTGHYKPSGTVQSLALRTRVSTPT